MMVVMMIEGEEGGKEREEGLEEAEEEGKREGEEEKEKRGRHCHSPCFIDETTKAQRGYLT